MQREKAKDREEKRVNVGQGDMRPEHTMQVGFLTGPKYLRPSASSCTWEKRARAKKKKRKHKNKPQCSSYSTVRVTGLDSERQRGGGSLCVEEAARQDPREAPVSPNFQPGVKSPIRWIPSSN